MKINSKFSDYNGFWGGRTRRLAPTPNLVGAALACSPFLATFKAPLFLGVPKIRYNQKIFYLAVWLIQTQYPQILGGNVIKNNAIK
ncbi:MAG: hypothetical protein DRR16_16000 [Candidatus Parabeggiatoa sp. nov. 3]|nr:MAG: hypothetical protein DRR00_04760 [Gammaproteobacteria bacterium]RKZ68784.1 MAG: hypothetical protein DRQ99_02740 [Gammaproteobacteria bacterium]RKZ83958.1 MAG: hypothetical protein DRR16_16000 [Gammaproteobacteria bacterium]